MKTIAFVTFILCILPLFGQDTFSFGTKGNYETAAHMFKLRNGSGKTMRITSVRSSCSCAVGDVDFKEVPPGGSASVTCRIDLKSLEGETAKNFWVRLDWEDAAEAAKTAEDDGKEALTLKGNETEIVLRMTGVVRTRVKLSSPEAVFKNTTPVEISLAGYAKEAAITAVKTPADTLFAYRLAANGRSVVVKPKGELPNGSWVELWTLSINDDNVRELPLYVRSLKEALIVPVPDTIQIRGKLSRRQVILRPADRKTAFNVTSAKIEPIGLEASAQNRKGRWIILLDTELQRQLPAESRLVITTDLAEQTMITVPIRR